jgi:proteasome activator subunit 4
MPGADLSLVRSWADFLQKLVGAKAVSRPKLDTTDLILDWRPLWRILQKELWPNKRIIGSGRNAVNLLLYVAEKCKRYYPSSEIPVMLDIFLPLFTKNVRESSKSYYSSPRII